MEGTRSNVTPPAATVKSELLIIYPYRLTPSYEYGVGVEFQKNVRFLSPELSIPVSPSFKIQGDFPGCYFDYGCSWPPEIW